VVEQSPVFHPTDEKHAIHVSSQAETVSYYPDDKICLPMGGGDTPSPMTPSPREQQAPPSTSNTDRAFLGGYSDVPCEERKSKPRFWKRYFVCIVVAIIFVIAGVIAIVVAITHSHKFQSDPTATSKDIPNNTLATVSSSGVFMKDKTTFNLQTFWQTTNGSIQYMISPDGKNYLPEGNLSLTVAPKLGSPLSSTAFTDTSGLVYLTLFYISTSNQIAMCSLACTADSTSCSSTSNIALKTSVPIHNSTGLSAVTVGDSQDWRIYYHDNSSYLSELQGNLAGFKTSAIVGGGALNGSSIAAVNVNTTTNNINVFYVDLLTKALYMQQFADGTWTIGVPLSAALISSWNPLSGLGAAYSSGQDQLHVYYTGLDTGVYEFLGNNASTMATVWNAQPGRNHIWAQADYVGADIAAVGWNDQVRFIQQQATERLVQGALSNTTWTEKFVL
ncbi:hypothetical protein LSUE1_G009886, partial [Lachnellula suecica]